MMFPRRTLAAAIGLVFVGIVAAPAAEPVDTLAEPAVPLFDGRSFDGWVMLDGSKVNDGWEVVDGVIHLKAGRERAGAIRTVETFENFVLEFEWRVARGGNSGVKYRVQEADSAYGRHFFGCEYQLLDDAGHKNGRNPLTTAGSLYGLVPADPEVKLLRPLGEFNEAKVVVKGNHIEHWLNGTKPLEATIGSDDWEARVRRSKVATVKDFGRTGGFILLQEHLSEAWFRNLRLTQEE